MTRTQHRSGRPYRRARLLMFAHFGTLCVHCGHEGADSADHLDPISLNPDQPVDWTRLRPAHGVKGCPTCGRKCNQSRGNRPMPERNVTSRDW